jgi:hypothetical protein
VTRRDIADALRRQRAELGITVVEAVRRSEVSRSTWRDLEAERRPGISTPVGVKLDKFLDWPAGTTVQRFYENEPHSNNGHQPQSARFYESPQSDRFDEMNDQLTDDRTAMIMADYADHPSIGAPDTTPVTESLVAALMLPVLLRLTPDQLRTVWNHALELALERHG